MEIHRDLALLHPACRASFRALADNMKRAFVTNRIEYPFEVFETYRSPQRQLKVVADGHSRATPWASAHNYGFAVDFVPRLAAKGGWFWPKAEDPCWDVLASEAEALGLVCDIKWDRPHVEHRIWRDTLRWILAKKS